MTMQASWFRGLRPEACGLRPFSQVCPLKISRSAKRAAAINQIIIEGKANCDKRKKYVLDLGLNEVHIKEAAGLGNARDWSMPAAAIGEQELA